MSALLKWVIFFAGVAVVAWIAATTDLRAVGTDMAQLGLAGGALVVIAFATGFTADVVAWLAMFNSMPWTSRGLGRLLLVQMVGEAVNTLMPFGSLGGEPVKAMLLKTRYGITYREATATLVLAQTVNTLAEVPFVAVGIAVMVQRHVLPAWAETAMVVGGACVFGFIVFVFVMLHLRWLAVLERKLGLSRWGEKLARGLAAFREVEQHLFTFVRHRPARFALAVAFSFVTWLSGAVETWIVLRFLGADVTWQDAWLVESAVVLVRNATFFVPAHMGSQDAVLVLVVGAITGSPELGLAVALIRRGRELITSSFGLSLGAWFGLRPTSAPT